MGVFIAVQAALYNQLNGAITYNGETVPVYDGAPSDREFPSITFGPSTVVSDDADCVDGREETVQIDIWTREQGRLRGCKIILDAVYEALHDIELPIEDPFAVNTCRISFAQVMKDPDGITAHGVLQVTVLVETTSGG